MGRRLPAPRSDSGTGEPRSQSCPRPPVHCSPPMKAVVEPLEGNKVKLSVEVDEGEFEQALDAAWRRMATQVRIPGFRPGKAPRKLLEARIGREAARQEALRE